MHLRGASGFMWSGGSEFDDLLKDFLNVAKEEAATGTFSMRLPTGNTRTICGDQRRYLTIPVAMTHAYCDWAGMSSCCKSAL